MGQSIGPVATLPLIGPTLRTESADNGEAPLATGVRRPMVAHRRFPPLALAALPFFALQACVAEPLGEPGSALDDTEETGDLAQEVTSGCVLGTPRCATLPVLGARAFPAERRAPARRRADIAMDRPANGPAEFETIPRIFAQRTTRTLRYDGTLSVLVAGSADGLESFDLDDALLVEVLGSDGATIAAGSFGPTVKLGGSPVTQIAAAEAGRVRPHDIAHLLPTDRPFRLRFSALDAFGSATIGAVHLATAALPPPPPPPPPPQYAWLPPRPWPAAFTLRGKTGYYESYPVLSNSAGVCTSGGWRTQELPEVDATVQGYVDADGTVTIQLAGGVSPCTSGWPVTLSSKVPSFATSIPSPVGCTRPGDRASLDAALYLTSQGVSVSQQCSVTYGSFGTGTFIRGFRFARP